MTKFHQPSWRQLHRRPSLVIFIPVSWYDRIVFTLVWSVIPVPRLPGRRPAEVTDCGRLVFEIATPVPRLPGPEQTLVVLQLAALPVVVGHAVAHAHPVLHHAQCVVATRVLVAKLDLDLATFAREP